MVTVHNFEVLPDHRLAISVETAIGSTIDKIYLWSMYDFKDYAKAINISDRILGINNKEALIISTDTIGLNTKKELIFMEVVSNETDCNSAMAVSYDTSAFQKCLLDYLFKEFNIDKGPDGCCGGDKSKDMTLMVSILIESVEKSLELGMYGQAIDMIGKLRKICGNKDCGCQSSDTVSKCGSFKQF